VSDGHLGVGQAVVEAALLAGKKTGKLPQDRSMIFKGTLNFVRQ